MQLCHQRGHLCEGCRSSDVLFPFQRPEVSQCGGCGACFHRACHERAVAPPQGRGCGKCRRIMERRRSRAAAVAAKREDQDDDE